MQSWVVNISLYSNSPLLLLRNFSLKEENTSKSEDISSLILIEPQRIREMRVISSLLLSRMTNWYGRNCENYLDELHSFCSLPIFIVVYLIKAFYLVDGACSVWGEMRHAYIISVGIPRGHRTLGAKWIFTWTLGEYGLVMWIVSRDIL